MQHWTHVACRSSSRRVAGPRRWPGRRSTSGGRFNRKSSTPVLDWEITWVMTWDTKSLKIGSKPCHRIRMESQAVIPAKTQVNFFLLNWIPGRSRRRRGRTRSAARPGSRGRSQSSGCRAGCPGCKSKLHGWLLYRVTHQVDLNLPLTSNQKFRFGLARPGQARPKRNFFFEVNGRFWSSGMVTLYMVDGYTGWLWWSPTWVGLTWIWIFHHLAHLPSRFCPTLIWPKQNPAAMGTSNSKSTTTTQVRDQMGHPAYRWAPKDIKL